MKRITFTFLALVIFISCAAQNQKARVFPNGIKVLGDPIITAVPLTSHIMILDQDGFSYKISFADFEDQLNISGISGLTVNPNSDPIEIFSGTYAEAQTEYGADPNTWPAELFGIIPDYPTTPVPLSSISYDNSTSGMSATNGQAAIDEMEARVDLNDAKVTNATHTGDVVGSTVLAISAGAVDTDELADNSVTADKISNGSILAEDLSSTFYIPKTPFTPVLEDAANGTIYSVTTNDSFYSKIGNRVFININIIGISTPGTPASTFLISGVPIPATTASTGQIISANVTGSNKSFYSIQARVVSNFIYLDALQTNTQPDAGYHTLNTVSFGASPQSTITISGTYVIN
ncbi:hypothetical protein [Flagellimonas marina]|uniref:Uncharacterized protein n=1 Tax=Flagellimonas marina TaxID=1775168 RepID=A0ABV8PG98_9FLAO